MRYCSLEAEIPERARRRFGKSWSAEIMSGARGVARAAGAASGGRRRELLDELGVDFGRRREPVGMLETAKGAPGGAVLGAVGLDRISELQERDLGGAHKMRSVVDALSAQERADRVGGERGGPLPAVG